MKIVDHLVTEGQGSYYTEDITAFQSGDIADRYLAAAITPGFKKAREIAETLSVGLVSEAGDVSWGDCVGVSYAAHAGRDGVFRKVIQRPIIKEIIEKNILGRDVRNFRESESLIPQDVPAAIQYGLSQALLSFAASARKKTMAETVCEEWGFSKTLRPLALQGSAGEKRIENAEKMIFNRLEILPHGQIDDIPKQLGLKGEYLESYAVWLVKRVREMQGDDYEPVIHLDVHGAIGKIFDFDIVRITHYIASLAKIVAPLELRLESVFVGRSFEEHMDLHLRLKESLRTSGSNVKLFIDEWATRLSDIRKILELRACDGIHIKMPNLGKLSNSIEAVRLCKERGVFALLGGSCIETDLSSRISLHVGLATQPEAFLVKPGMGIDEGISNTRNEMARVLAQIRPGPEKWVKKSEGFNQLL